MICTVDDYQRITGDTATAPADVEQYITEAQEFIESETDKRFSSAQRTETLYVYPDGRVYPHATPVTAVASPAGAVFTTVAIGAGAGLLDAGVWPDRCSRPTRSVTYTGGYADGQAPAALVRLIARVAQSLKPSGALAGLPAGITSVNFGSQSYTGRDLGDSDALPTSIIRQINKLKYRAA